MGGTFDSDHFLQVMLSSVVTHSSSCKVAPAALLELRMACDLFEKAAAHGGRAKKFLVRISFLTSRYLDQRGSH
jgi:hypothetical protein